MYSNDAVLLAVGASAAFTAGWYEFTKRYRERRSHQQLCKHQWTEPIEVVMQVPPRGQRFWKRFCPACGSQMNCNEDGTPYVPYYQRKDLGDGGGEGGAGE